MNKDELKTNLDTKHLGQELFFYPKTVSTNTEARTIANTQTVEEGCTIVAAEQSQGKGSDGNHWHSSRGNIYLSIIFPFNEKITTLFPLYPAVALSKVLRKEYKIAAHVKWPNDVLVGSKKIAGILCEGVSGKYMIMGIGVNVLQTTFEGDIKDKASSIALESNITPKLTEVFQSFLKTYEDLFYNNCNIREEWIKHTQMIGKTITTIQDGHNKKVTVKGLSPEGFLEIINEKGENETWMARSGLDINAEY